MKKKNILDRNNYLKFFPFILIVLLIGLIYMINYFFNARVPLIFVENNGYMLGSNEIANILNKEDLSKFDKNLDIVKMEEFEYIYKLAFDKYSNEEKKIVDINYPLFINDGLSIVNYNDNTNLIDNKLRRTIGYVNQVFSYGRVYELNDYEPIDNINYLLLAYSNGIYINLYDLNIKTNANEYFIPVNSFIYFMDDRINYYERKDNNFVKKQIVDIDFDSILSFVFESSNQKYDFKYENFLLGLGKIHKEEEIYIPPKPIIEEEEQIEVIDTEQTIDDNNDTDYENIGGNDNEKPFVWIKPSVTSTRLSANVYSATGKISINDPASVIVKAPSYTFIYKEKTYSRRSFYSSGDLVIAGLRPDSTFDVVGQYTYLDEDLKTKKIVTFYHDTISTKSLDSLDPIDLKFTLGDIYPKKIELATLQITSDINSEALKGVRTVAFTINNENYYFSSQTISKLINGKILENVGTSESLASDSMYDFEINIYDTIGNKLNVRNNKGSTRTSKKYPNVLIKLVENEIDYVVLGIDLKNDDDVNVSNYHYVITNTSGKVMQQGAINSNRIRVENLDPNQIFNIKVFGDFDLDDGKGLKKDYELTSLDFTSLPITSLGYVNLNIDIDDINSDSARLKLDVNSKKTDARLMKLLKGVKIDVYNDKTQEVVRTFNLNKNEISNLSKYESIMLNIGNLDSNTKYLLNIGTIVQQGETVYNLECLHNLEFFETHKKKPIVDMESSFVTNDMIDFDLKIIDLDAAILNNKVRVELRDGTNKLVNSKIISVNQDFERITYKYLSVNANYNIIFIADEYNETNNNSTFKAKYELNRIQKYTEDGISGKIEINSAIRVANGENLADLTSESKWIQTTNYYTVPKTTDSDGHMHIYSKKGSSAYTYNLSDYHGEHVTATFKIKAINKLEEKVYFGNYISGTTSASYGIYLDNISTDGWTTYSYSFVVGYYASGKHFVPNRSLYYGKYYTDFVGFYINSGKDETSEYEIKDFEIHRIKERVTINLDEYKMEKGTYNSNGSKNDSATYYNNRIRVNDAIILDGDNNYEIVFSDDLNYSAYIYFTDMNNKYLSAYGWFDSDRIVYVPKNSKMYISFRYYSGNVDLNPEDINLKITKYENREDILPSPFTYDFVTTIKLNIKDLHNEIANDTFYVRVSDENNNEIYVNEYKELVDVDRISDELKKIDLEENKKYHISLFIKIRDREYELDYFDISTDKETVGISTVNDWALIQPNGNYIVLNDLDFDGFTLQTLGWGYRYFYGMIDFQGYSANVYSKNNYQRIGRIEKDGIIKNLVLNVHLNNEVNNNGIRGFVATNYGTIENVIINVFDERQKYFNDLYLCTLVDNNAIYGRVRNFVVNLKTKVNLYWDNGLLVRENYGLIENGYVYGENAFVTNERSGASARMVSLVQRYGGLKSVLQNVFVLSSIEFPNNYTYDITGLVAYETYGTLKNVYTTGNVSNRNQAVGPIIGYVRATAEYSNAYYLNDYVYTTLNQNRISATTLNDKSFQKNVLQNGFNIDEMIELGYYPQVMFTYEKMPKQDYIELPKGSLDEVIDILNIDVVSKTNNSAIVDLTILNEFGDEILDIGISNLDTEILSQSFEDGKSLVRIQVTNPQTYVSRYEIRSIVSKSFSNIISEKRYITGDKYLYVDLYREIHNITDWLSINKYLNQNFAIMEDLDFREYANYYINNYSGNMNGNNHTLRNINIISNKSGLFNQFNGILKDITFENITKTSDTNYSGIIGYSNQYAKFNNVHVKNVDIVVPSTRVSNSVSAGGLVGNVYYSKFTNCTVTNVKISMTAMITDVQVGGMVGYSNGGTFTNVYVQNVDIKVDNTISTNGVGGIIGREVATVGIISDAYVVGKLYTNGRYLGGVVGNTQGYIERTYAMVDMVSELMDIGGITGRAGYPNNINNNLFIGNMASKLIGTPMYRIIGTAISQDNNYGLDNALFNGLTSSVINGESLISYNDLMNSNNYNNDNGLQLGEAFDYSKVSSGIIPKLYYMDTDELLPNQDDIRFFDDPLETIDYVVDKHAEFSNIVFYLKNPNHYTIDEVVIEDMNVEIIDNSFEDGISIVTVKAVPIKYYDSYYVKEIKYHSGNNELSCSKMIFLEMIFYKNLRTFEDWQNVSIYDAENYILLNDIDFTGKTFNRNVIFNRLETISEDEPRSLIGMDLVWTTNKSDINIINRVITSIKNINFKDINIEYLQTSNNDYVNVIDYAYGEIYNLTFENIKINAPYKNRVSMIGRALTHVIDGIKLKDIELIGKGYVSGFLAYYENEDKYTISNIDAENINITATANYAGGIFANFSKGSSDNVVNIYNVNIKDSTINAPNSSYVGGIAAYAGSSYATVDNVNVIGREYVGGAFGYSNGYMMYEVNVMNSNISGSYRYIGGIAGQMRNSLYDSYVINTHVDGTAVDTYGVGGVFGYHSHYTASRNYIKDSYVNNNGNSTGGFVGSMANGTISVSSVDNVIVNGMDYVGGMVGNLTGGVVTTSKVTNSTINAQSSSAGGLVGYHNNSITGASFYEGAIRQCMVLNNKITSGTNAGGFIGQKNETLYYPQNNYGLYFDSSVSSTDSDNSHIASGDNSNDEFINLGRMGFYQNSLLNNNPIKNYVSSNVDDTNLITNVYSGYINETTGVPEINYYYPLSSYTDFIELKANKTYVITASNVSKSTADIFRVRYYDSNYNYIGNLNNSGNTWNYFGNYYNLSNLREIYLTPVKNVYIRILYLYEMEESTVKEVKSSYGNMQSSKLFNETQLRNRILWNRYMSDNKEDFYYVTYFNYDTAIWDFSPLKSEITNLDVIDKSSNNHNAKASFTSICDDGLFVGGVNDQIVVNNYTPKSDITISTVFTSYSGRSYQFLFSYRDPSKNSGVGLFLHGRTLHGMVNGSNYNTGYTIPLYKEISVTMTYQNNNILKIYVNGELIYSNLNVRKTIITSENALTYIANDAYYATNVNYKFLGIIKSMSVYERALDENEIMNNYYQSTSITNSEGLQLHYDFTDISYDEDNIGYYPLLIDNDGQAKVPLPRKANGFLGMSYRPNRMAFTPIFNEKLEGKYHIYSSGIDTINIEFDKISNDLSFTYKLKEKEVTIDVNKRVYTLFYDYKSDIEITIRNSFEEIKENLKSSDLAKTMTLDNDNYYHIENNDLYKNDEKILDNALHIFKNLVILDDNQVYNISNGEYQKSLNNNNLVVKTIPLYQTTIDGNIISTYYNFTEIVNSDGDIIIKDEQLIYKNGYLHIINSVDKINNSIIVNNYNGSEYQIILGNNKELYSYETSLNLHSSFINRDIKEIYSSFDTDLPIIMVRYNNGELLVLNYYNGEKLYQYGDKQNIMLLDFIALSLQNNDMSINNNSYDTSNSIKSSIDDLTDEKIMDLLKTKEVNNSGRKDNNEIDKDAIINNNTVNNKYVVSFNENTKEYELYDINDILNADIPVSINTKIKNNKTLYNYFYNKTNVNDLLKDNRLIIYIGIILLILVNLVYLVIKSKKRVEYEK